MPLFDDATKNTDKLREHLELIVQTGLLLSRSVDLPTLVQAATDAGLRISGAQFGAFFYNVIDPAGESYLLYTLSGVDRSKFANFPMPRNTAVFGPTFEGKGVVRSGDITKDPRYGHNAPFYGMPKGHLPVRSYLAIPVKAQSGEVLGGLFYGHADQDVFQQSVEDLIGTIASQAAVAIENFRLRDQLTRQVDALQQAEVDQRQASKSIGELAAIVQSSDDAILSKDLNGVITSCNKAATALFGYTQEEIVGQSILRLIPEELHSEEPVILAKIRAGERIEHFETFRLKKNGERFPVSLTISPVRDKSGVIIGASKILRDISHRRKVEASLVQAEKLAATGRMAATIAHEINNPLEAVMNLVFLARQNISTDNKAQQYLATAEGELERVSQIARQTLGYYRDVGKPVEVYVSDLLENVLAVYRSKAFAAEIRIDARFEDTEPIVLSRGETLQVLSNIVANALDSMPAGGILHVSSQKVIRDGEPGIQVCIRDTGVGIPAENLNKVFEPFFTTKGDVGTGIGLWVVRQLVENRGGHISIHSSTEAGKSGTTAEIFMPFALPASGSGPVHH
jgi:PAS domain S-box-containing protein